MAVAEEILVNVVANTERFNRSMKKAANDADAFKKKVKSLSTILGTRFTRALNSASKSAVSLGKSLTVGLTLPLTLISGFALKAAAELESLETSFQTLTGSVAKGTALFKELIAFSDVTPFDPVVVARAARTLVAFGVDAADVVPILSRLGDVAGADAQKLNELALVFGKVKVKGKLAGEELQSLREKGFAPLAILAKDTGKSVAQLTKEVSEGKITITDLARAFELATTEGGLFFENLKKQSRTLTGLFSTLTGSINILLGGFGNIIVDALGVREGFDDLTAITRSFGASLKEAASQFPAFTKFLISLAVTAALAGPALFVVGKALALIAAMVSPIGLVVVSIIAVIGAATLLSDAASGASESWVRFSEGIIIGLEGVRHAFAVVVTSIKFAWDKALNEMATFFATFISAINSGIDALPFVEASQGIEDLADKLRQGGENALTFKERMAALTAEHKRNLEAIRALANAKIEDTAVTNELDTATDGLIETTKKLAESLKDAASSAEDASKELDSLLNKVGALSTRLRNQKETLKQLEEALAKHPKRHQEITDAIEKQKETIRDLESEGAGAFSELSRGAEGFEDAIVSAMLGSENAIDSFFESFLRQASQAFLKQAVSGLTGAFTGGGGGGGGLLGGIASGIGSSISSGIGSLFGGFFAQGGTAPANKLSVVGERGPEIIMPSSPLDVIPISSGGFSGSTGGGGGGIVQNIFLNNQIDARGADANVEQRIRRVVEQEEPRIIKRAVSQSISTLRFEVNRGGQLSKDMGRRRA